MAEHNTLLGSQLHEPKGADTALIGQTYVADGAGGGTWVDSGGSIYGQMDVLNNVTTVGLTGVADFDNPLNYIKVTGIWSTPTGVTNSGIIFSTDKLTVSKAGVYRVEFWASFTIPINSDLAFKFGVNTSLSLMKMKRSATSSTAYGVAAGHTMVDLAVNDEVSLHTMSDTTGNLLIENGVFMIQLVEEA